MSRRSLRPLVFLNAGLLVALATVTLMPSAFAQLRPRSTYTMVGGTVNGINLVRQAAGGTAGTAGVAEFVIMRPFRRGPGAATCSCCCGSRRRSPR